MSNLTISNPLLNIESSIINEQQNPIATKIAYLDPSGATRSSNVFTTWDAAYNNVKDVSGIRIISFVKQPGDENAGRGSYFNGASGTYNMTNIYLYYDSPLQQLIQPTAGFSLQDLPGIIAVNAPLSWAFTDITQNFIVLTNSNPDVTAKTILFCDQLFAVDPPAGTYIIYGTRDALDTYDTVNVRLVGRLITMLTTVRFIRMENGINIIYAIETPNLSFFTAASIETDTGDLTIDQSFQQSSVPLLAAAYANVGGTVTVSTPESVRVHTAAADPTVNDDGNGASNYAIGTIWVNTTSDNAFICGNNADGAAVWRPV